MKEVKLKKYILKKVREGGLKGMRDNPFILTMVFADGVPTR